MIKPINSDLKHRTANILRNDRVSLTNTTNPENQAKKATKEAGAANRAKNVQ